MTFVDLFKFENESIHWFSIIGSYIIMILYPAIASISKYNRISFRIVHKMPI